MKLAALIEQVLTADPSPTVADDVDTWWAGHRARSASTAAARAVLGGFAADRLGWAFASGYQSAGEALFGDGSPSEDLAALCATEKGGVHPRAIATTVAERLRRRWQQRRGSEVLAGSAVMAAGAAASRRQRRRPRRRWLRRQWQ